jgi:hypothetical protein
VNTLNRKKRRAHTRVREWYDLEPGTEKDVAWERACRDVQKAGYLPYLFAASSRSAVRSDGGDGA